MNLENIKTKEEAQTMIRKLEDHIRQISDNDKKEELFQNGLKHKLTWDEIINLNIDDELYLVVLSNKGWIDKGGIIKVKISKITRKECQYRTYKNIETVAIKNEYKSDNFTKWNVVNRINHHYKIEIDLDNEIIRLVDPILYSNVNNLIPVQLYYRISKIPSS